MTTADLVIGETMRDPGHRGLFRRRPVTASARHWRLRDVTLYPKLALAFSGSQVIPETRFSVFDHEIEAARRDLAAPHLRFRGPRTFMGFNRPCVNHFHIVTQIVPAIASYLVDPGFRDGTLLMPALTAQWSASQALTARAMDLAGIYPSNVHRVGGEPLDIDDLTVSSYLTGCDGPSLFCREVFDCMAERAVTPKDWNPPRQIYIQRSDTPMRPMRNEAALAALLKRYGVEPVVLSTTTLDEQIALFRGADLVIGAHGAGLANIVFSRAGAVLYELLPSHYINPCVAHLAELRGLHYWCDVHPSDDRSGTWRHHVPWSADLDAVERRLAKIMSRYTGPRPAGDLVFHPERPELGKN